MAEETAPKPADAASKSGAAAGAAAPSSGPHPIVLIATVVAALAAGGAAGAFLIGPRLVPARPKAAAKPAADGVAAAAAGEEHGGKDGAKRGMYKIENLIVNPAGSQGTRFLMATVAFDVPDEKLAAALKERDVQLRDAVISALESDTMDELTRAGARDSVKAQVARAVKPVTRDIPSMRIYLPQFVIQ